ncbi:MAG: tetratricopeptide repeat protein [candidate division Zixibacteria bacterium]|nr:tetratricopeptide repeat protein [candidate division Zixibacteria bacterium]
MSKFFQKETCFILGLFIFAFLVRFIYLNQMKNSPLFDAPLIDAKYHDQWAQTILKGQDFAKGVFFRAPLYPYFLALVYKIFGHNFYMVRLIQFLIGSLSCVLVYLIGKKIFNPRVGRIAGMVASVYGILIYFEGELLIPVLIVFLDLVLILALFWAKAKPSYGRWIVCGGLLGLSALARPNILLVGVAFFFWILFYFPQGTARQARRPIFDPALRPETQCRRKAQTRRERSRRTEFLKSKAQTYRKSLLYAVSFAFGTILIISPVTLRNYVKGNDFVLIASQGGLNFYIGNNPQSDGASALLPGARSTWWGMYDDAKSIAEKSMHKKLKPSEISRFWYGGGMKFLKDRPFDFLSLILKKIVLFWNGNELSNNKDIYFFTRKAEVLKGLIWKFVIFFPFGIMCPLALLGMILSYKQFKNTLVLLLFVFVYMVSIILFFVTARYRVPVLPVLIIFSAYALDWLLVRIKEKRFSALGKYLFILVLISIPINVNIPGYKSGYEDQGVAESHSYLGFAYREKGDISNAIKEYKLALSYDPNLAYVYVSLGELYREQGKYTQALQEFEKALSHGADSAIVLYDRGMIYYTFGLLDKAEEDYRLSIVLRDNDYFPHYFLGGIYVEKGMWDLAITEHQLVLQYNPDFAPSYYELGLLYHRLGKKDQAIYALENFIKLWEGDPNQIKEAQRLLKELKTE